MTRKYLVGKDEKSSCETVYRVRFIDENNVNHEEKYTDEQKARERFYSLESPIKIRQLDMIKQCKFITLDWDRLTY